MIFTWEKRDELSLGEGDRLFLELLSLRWNFPRHSPSSLEFYLSGEKPEFLDFFPELLYLRDIVFTFKSLMTPEASSLPDLRRWSLADASLRWRFDLVKQTYTVTAFQKSLSCELFGKDHKLDYYEKSSQQQGHQLSSSSSAGGHSKSIFQRFVHWLGVREKPRAPPSGADPTNLLYFTSDSKTITSSSSSSGGGKASSSSSSSSVHDRITCEEDVLHVKKLPTFNRRLRPQDCELLLQYLTAPYIRIPLITQFFTEEGRIDCLSVSALQHVLEAVLFEPWQYQKDEKKRIPEAIPPSNREYFATPLGLLFNELIYSPDILLSSLLELLEIAIDKDTGYYNSPNASILLYIIRLIVRLQGYVLFILRYHLYWEEHWDGGKVPTLAEIDLRSRRSKAQSLCRRPRQSRVGQGEVGRRKEEEEVLEPGVPLALGEKGGGVKKEEEQEPGRPRETPRVDGEEKRKNEESLHPSSSSVLCCSLPISRSGWRSRVRGLQCPSAKTLDHLKQWNRKLESRLHGEILHILETWAYKAVSDGDIRAACRLYAHIALLYQHCLWEDLSLVSVSALLVSLFFIFSHHKFTIELPKSLSFYPTTSAFASHPPPRILARSLLLTLPEETRMQQQEEESMMDRRRLSLHLLLRCLLLLFPLFP